MLTVKNEVGEAKVITYHCLGYGNPDGRSLEGMQIMYIKHFLSRRKIESLHFFVSK